MSYNPAKYFQNAQKISSIGEEKAPNTYPPDRRCIFCNKKLSIYNPGPVCYVDDCIKKYEVKGKSKTVIKEEKEMYRKRIQKIFEDYPDKIFSTAEIVKLAGIKKGNKNQEKDIVYWIFPTLKNVRKWKLKNGHIRYKYRKS